MVLQISLKDGALAEQTKFRSASILFLLREKPRKMTTRRGQRSKKKAVTLALNAIMKYAFSGFGQNIVSLFNPQIDRSRATLGNWVGVGDRHVGDHVEVEKNDSFSVCIPRSHFLHFTEVGTGRDLSMHSWPSSSGQFKNLLNLQ